jgi:hypothetical protein
MNGGRLSGVRSLRPETIGGGAETLPPSSLLTFSDDIGGETNNYTGFDASVTAPAARRAVLQRPASTPRSAFSISAR